MRSSSEAEERERPGGRISWVDMAPVLAVVGSAIAFSLSTVMARVAFRRGASIDAVVLGRLTIGALVLWCAVLASRVSPRMPGRRGWLLLALGIMPSTQIFFLYQSVARVPASVATLLLYSYPALVTVMVLVLGRERPSSAKLLALALSACGLLLILGLPAQDLDAAGVVFGLLAAAFLATWLVIADGATRHVPPTVSAALLLSGGAISYAAVSIASGTARLSTTDIGWSIPIGIGSAVALLLVLVALQRLRPSTISIASTVEPLSTSVLSAVLLSEALGPLQALGGGFILGGLVTAARANSGNGVRGDG